MAPVTVDEVDRARYCMRSGRPARRRRAAGELKLLSAGRPLPQRAGARA